MIIYPLMEKIIMICLIKFGMYKVKYMKIIDRNAVDLLKNILVPNPSKMKKLEQIKKYVFYLNGKKNIRRIISKLG